MAREYVKDDTIVASKQYLQRGRLSQIWQVDHYSRKVNLDILGKHIFRLQQFPKGALEKAATSANCLHGERTTFEDKSELCESNLTSNKKRLNCCPLGQLGLPRATCLRPIKGQTWLKQFEQFEPLTKRVGLDLERGPMLKMAYQYLHYLYLSSIKSYTFNIIEILCKYRKFIKF